MAEYLEGLAELLDSMGLALFSPTGPTSIFLDYTPERAEHCLTLTCYGGDLEGPPRESIWPRVQVRARGDRQSPRWSRDMLARTYRALHGYKGELPNGVRLLNCYGLQSAPQSLGPDGDGRFEHVLNFQLWVCDAVPMQPEEAITNASTQS